MANFIEHIEHERISWKLPTGIILFVLVILLGFVLAERPKYTYEVSVKEMHAQVLKPEENTISLQQVAQILKSDPKGEYRFIDLRNPQDFVKGHIPGAINIPVHHLLDEEHTAVLQATDGKTNILYYSEHTGACAPWMLLRQMGFANNKLMVGGYALVKENILDSVSTTIPDASDEKARFDYAEIVKTTPGAGSGAASQVAGPAPVVAKRKRAAVQGGC